MTAEEKEKAIRQLLWGRKYASVLNSRQQLVHLQSRALTTVEQAEADAIRDRIYNDNTRAGIISERDLMHELESRGLWSKADDDAIASMRKESRRLQEEANTVYRFDKHNKNRTLARAKRVDLAASKLIERRYSLLSPSAEYISDIEKVFWILQRVVYTEDGETKYWPTLAAIRNERDSAFIIGVLNEYNQSIFSTADIRELARSGQWRFRWSGGKNNISSLFGVGYRDLTVDQEAILYWSQVYDSVYASAEPPSDLTIENDDSLDQWLEQMSKKNKAEQFKKDRKNPRARQTTGGAISREETFVMVRDRESAREIQDMNSEATNRQIDKEVDKILQKGQISEHDLRFKK